MAAVAEPFAADAALLPDPRLPLAAAPADCVVALALPRHAARIAVDSAEGQSTYAALDQAAERIAARLTRLPAASIVAVHAARNASLVASLAAVVRSGHAFVVLDQALPAERIRQCIELAQPTAVINATGAGRPDVGPGAREHIDATEALVSGRHGPDAGQSRRTARVDAHTLMYVAFTSGSTGFPKAVLGEHGPVAHFFDWQRRRFELTEHDRFSVLSGLGHDPLLRDILLPLTLGAAVCVPPRDVFSVPHRAFEWLREARVSVCHLTPTLAQIIIAGARSGSVARLDGLRYAFFGGEPLTYALVKRFKAIAPNAAIVNCYGATETPQVMACHPVPSPLDSSLSGLVPVGRGIEGVQLLVMDPERNLCAIGEEGEICIRTPHLAREVWGPGRQPLPVFFPNPRASDPGDRVYATGDRGVYLDDGAVAFRGRTDRQFKVRGHRVELGEIEAALTRDVEISGCHFDLQPTASGAPSFVLYYVPATGRDNADGATVRQRLQERLPDYMIPDRVIPVGRLPITANGKIDVDALRRSAASVPAISPSASGDAVVQELCDLITRATGLAVGPADDLRRAGLNSLQAVMLCCTIEEEFGVSLSAGDIASCATPLEVAAAIRAHSAGPRTEIPATTSVMSDVGATERTPLLPRNEPLFVAIRNRLLQILARVAPDALRVRCHRWRGVAVGGGTSIGYDTIVETAYPWLVAIGKHVNISMRVTIIGHFRGMGAVVRGRPTVVIEDEAFIGPNVTILPNVRIGRGAVISAGSVVNADIPPLTFAHGNPAVPVAACGRPLSGDTEYAEFLKQLRPLNSAAGASRRSVVS